MPEYKISCDIHDNKLTDITVPLIEELQIINSFNHNFLIIIDDYSLFGVNEIQKIFKNRLENYYIHSKSMLVLKIKK